MTIYVDAYHDICHPLAFCDKIIPGSFGWRALKMVHRIWWFKTRKQKLMEESDKLNLALKAFFQSIITYSSIATSAAQFLLIVVKIEETFTAFDESQKRWRAISATWKGDYYISGSPPIHKRIVPTAKAIFHYLSASFCLVMTFIDVVDAMMFSKKTSCEATLLVKNNLTKVIRYCKQDSEELRNKLFSNKRLIEVILKKTNQKKSASEFINDLVINLKEYHRISEIVSNTSSQAYSIMSRISEFARTVIHMILWIPDEPEISKTTHRFCKLSAYTHNPE